MIQQYPYILKIRKETESKQDEETGNWVENTAEWIEIGKCREEINGAGRKVTTEDGQTFEYGWLIYAPKYTERISQGTLVQVYDPVQCYVRAEKPVLRFSKDQLHCRIWL